MKKVTIKNKKGQEAMTTMSSEVINQLGEFIEAELIADDIDYERNGTEFKVKDYDMPSLYNAQSEANMKLIKMGVITLDMIMNDIEAN